VGGARVTVHIPREYRDDLERLARDRGVSLGELVRQAISELLTRAREGELVVVGDAGEPLHRRVAEAVTELVSRVEKPGVIPRDDVNAFLTRHGLASKSARVIFRQVLRHELARRGFELHVLSSGALIITRAGTAEPKPTPS
jgi:antitoxin (DNA-binding transcriptional repressor) of toxin-antitoxin stability system